jgi:hypothetical protein
VRIRENPEHVFRTDLIAFLKARDWMVEITHGNEFQTGLADLYLAHLMLGTRWCELKIKGACHFTTAQLQKFPNFTAHGVGVWVLSVTKDELILRYTRRWEEILEREYKLLFRPANWHQFLNIYNPHSR